MRTTSRSASSNQKLAAFAGPILLLIVCGCHSSEPATAGTAGKPAARDPRYPAHWWQPVSGENKPAWEILPHEAGPGELILSKRNELGLLSNFAATPFEFRSKRYASLEGFWQAMKYPEGPDDPRANFPGLEWRHTRDEVAQLTGFDAKAAGDVGTRNMRKMGIDWVTFDGQRMPYRPGRGPEDEAASENHISSEGDAGSTSPDLDATRGEHYRLIVAATWEKVRQNPEVARVLLSTGDLVLKPDHHQEANPPAAWRYYDILSEIRDELRHRP